MRVAGEAVELCDDQRGAVCATHSKGLRQLGAVGPLASFDLGERGDQAPAAARVGDVVGNGLALRIQAEAGPGPGSKRGNTQRKNAD